MSKVWKSAPVRRGSEEETEPFTDALPAKIGSGARR
jgi:hypothetical protein